MIWHRKCQIVFIQAENLKACKNQAWKPVRTHCRRVLPRALLLGRRWMLFAKRLLLLVAFCAFGQQSLLWIMDFSKNGPAVGKGKAVCAFYKIKGIPWVHEKKNKKCLRQCFSQNGFKSAQEKQTGLMHNTRAEYFIILRYSFKKNLFI